MSGESFGIEKEFLHDILKQVRDGKTQLPDFQRGWVWPDRNVASLLASVSQSYPVGTIMMLRNGGDVRFKERPVEGAIPTTRARAERLILDGQQRTTALFQALMLDRPVKTQDTRKKPLDVWFHISMVEALDPRMDREDTIVTLPADKCLRTFRGEVERDYSTPEAEYRDYLFPLSRVFNYEGWEEAFQEYWEYDKEKIKLWQRFRGEVVERFRHYQVPVIELASETRRQAVCQVFEKVNTGGVTLTVFELLTATYAAEEFELRRDWEDKERQFKTPERRILSEFSNTDFLQAVTLLATREARERARANGADDERAPRVGCKRTDMLNLSLDSYRRWSPVVVEGLKRAAHFLHKQYVYDPKFLPYGGQLVPLVSILGLLGSDWDRQGTREKLERWYWCGVFGELYGGTTETRFSRDLIEVLAWTKASDEIPRTVFEATFAPGRLLTLRTRISAAYKGIYALLLKEGARDWRTGVEANIVAYFDDAIDIHHIFPKAWCEQQTIDPKRYDSIVNKTPLTARTNRAIGGRAPSEYMSRVASGAGIAAHALDGNVATHLIEPGQLRTDSFDSFFDTRSDQLLHRIEATMGKPSDPSAVAASPEEVEPSGYEEFAAQEE